MNQKINDVVDSGYGEAYELIRSKRKTMAIQVDERGEVTVRAPKWVPKWQIQEFLLERREWILKQQRVIKERNAELPEFSSLNEGELLWLKNLAEVCIPDLTEIWAPIIGVKYNKITIRHQRTRWGSCTADGNLNFNCLLMLAPPYVREYVVVHELCHIKHMDHSPAFWREVEKALPNYRDAQKWLKEQGRVLIARVD